MSYHLRSIFLWKEQAMMSRLVDRRYWLLVGPLMLWVGSAALAGDNRNFNAKLSGDGEVPPRETRGHGIAKLQLSYDGSELSYHLNVANINNVVAAAHSCRGA